MAASAVARITAGMKPQRQYVVALLMASASLLIVPQALAQARSKARFEIVVPPQLAPGKSKTATSAIRIKGFME